MTRTIPLSFSAMSGRAVLDAADFPRLFISTSPLRVPGQSYKVRDIAPFAGGFVVTYQITTEYTRTSVLSFVDVPAGGRKVITSSTIVRTIADTLVTAQP